MNRRPHVRVVINADDLGLNAHVNDRIFASMARHSVTSATIIANSPSAEAAMQRIPEFPHCSFGVHLNLSEFTPIEHDRDLDPIVGDDGAFMKGAVARKRLSLKLLRAVEREFDRQIGRVREHGIVVSHLDSHHHVHTIPELFFALKAVQRRHGIKRVRIARNLHMTQQTLGRRLKKAAWNAALRHLGRTRTTMLFCDLTTFMHAAWKIAAPTTAEIMVHPGHPDYSEEERLLDGPWWLELPMNLELVSYNRI